MTRIAIVALLIIGSAAVADACECVRLGAPCAAFWRTDAVFAGRVVDITPVSGRPLTMAVRFAVDKRGRGVDSDTIVVEAEPDLGGNCGFTFQLGERYVVYAATSSGGQLITTLCSGTKRAVDASADLAFLDELAGPQGVRIFGDLRRVENDLTSLRPRSYGGVEGARITVSGNGITREAQTRADGHYEFGDLPSGTYTVSMGLPPGLVFPRLSPAPVSPSVTQATVTLTHPHECAQLGAAVSTDSQIAGVLFGTDGRPLDNEPVDLIAAVNASAVAKEIPHLSTRTDASGHFTFLAVAPGTYVVGINLAAPPPAAQLDRRAYHPGVRDASAATVVTVGPGSRIQLAPFTVPDAPRDRRITVVIVWNDGTPAPGASIVVYGASSTTVNADATGRSTFTLPYGAEFGVSARASRTVDGRSVGGYAPYQRIGRDDRDQEITLTLRPER